MKKTIIRNGMPLLVIILCAFIFPLTTYATHSNQDITEGETVVEWRTETFSTDMAEYALVPENTEEWAKLNTHADKIDALTIQEETLNIMSPEGIVATALEYPLFANMFAFNTYQQGFEVIANESNVIEAMLEQATETAPILQDLFIHLDLGTLLESDELAVLRLPYMSMILSQDCMLNSLSNEELDELLIASNNMIEAIQSDFEDYYDPSFIYRLEGRILSIRDAEFGNAMAADPDLQAFIDGDRFMTSTMIQTIESSSTLVSATSTSYIETPNGSSVEVIVYDEYPQQLIDAINNQYTSTYTTAIFVNSSSKRYNCHSYAWYLPSPSNIYWINDPEWRIFVSDGSYSYVGASNGTIPSTMPINAKVEYTRDDHSAIIYSHSYLQSKWGEGPVMRLLMIAPMQVQAQVHWYFMINGIARIFV